jgi:hypothetical protein
VPNGPRIGLRAIRTAHSPGTLAAMPQHAAPSRVCRARRSPGYSPTVTTRSAFAENPLVVRMADKPDRGAPPASSGAKVVLVVNDDPMVRGRVARILAEAGYAVLTASDREDALVLARKLGDRLALVVVGSD